MRKNKLFAFFGSLIAASIFGVITTTSNIANNVKPTAAYYAPVLKNEVNEETHIIWENDGSSGLIAWNSMYSRFGLDGCDPSYECFKTFPQDMWNIIKGETFYTVLEPVGTDVCIRVTTGWWDPVVNNYSLDDCVENPDGTYTLELNFAGDPILDVIDQRHLLFTGGCYYLQKIYYKTSDPTPIPVVTHDIVNNYKIDDKEQNHGYLTINKNDAASEDICTITVNPLRGYALKEGSLKVYKSDDPTTTYDVILADPDIEWVYVFNMPDNEVAVSAEFVPAPLPIPPNPYLGRDITHWVFTGLAVALVGFTLILWFVFKIRNFQNKKEDKLNIAPIIGFAIHLALVVVTSIIMQCLACYILLGVNIVLLAAAIGLYLAYKEKDKNKEEK